MLTRMSAFAQMLRTDPLGGLIFLAMFAVAILLSLILHECAHGYVALKCGDPTAKYMGRLTLDPRKHLDPMGTVFMVLLGFGWAKPVPVNPRNYRNPKRDDILVSIACICMNLVLFLVSMLLYVVLIRKASSSSSVVAWIREFLYMLCSINVSLAVFNLLPIPPLDGYHVVNDILLKGRLQLDYQTFRIAQIVLLVLCFSGALSGILSTVNNWLMNSAFRFFLSIIH